MHLVVLKRNNIDVPETLPPILKPAYLHQRLSKANRKIVLKPSVPNHNKDLYNGRDATTPSNPESLNASLLNNQEDELDHAKADKKELNDVTDTASIISSPGLKSFYFAKISRNQRTSVVTDSGVTKGWARGGVGAGYSPTNI